MYIVDLMGIWFVAAYLKAINQNSHLNEKIQAFPLKTLSPFTTFFSKSLYFWSTFCMTTDCFGIYRSVSTKDVQHMWPYLNCFFFHYVPMINSIFIWMGSTWASKRKHTKSKFKCIKAFSSQHSTLTC